MSKKKDNTIAYVLIGAALFLFSRRRNQQPPPQYAPQFTQVPPPPSNAQSFANWASAILSIYGNVSSLWQPGGPFHNYNSNDIYDAANAGLPDYNNPYVSNTGGWT